MKLYLKIVMNLSLAMDGKYFKMHKIQDKKVVRYDLTIFFSGQVIEKFLLTTINYDVLFMLMYILFQHSLIG